MATVTASAALYERAATAVNNDLYNVVMTALKVQTGSVFPLPELTEGQTVQVGELRHQLAQRATLLEEAKSLHQDRNFGPVTVLPGMISEGLYGLRMSRPQLQSNCINMLSLSTLHSRRVGLLVAPLQKEVLLPGLTEPHLSYCKTEVEVFRNCELIHATATEDFPTVLGETVTEAQTDWTLTLALPKSQLMQFVRGELPLTVFMHSQINFWYTARSSILRALHMFWQQMPLVATENLCLLMFNPLKTRFSTGEILTAPGPDEVYTFNRLYLDHCITTGSTDAFPLFQQELATALIVEMNGITLQALAPLHQELNCNTLFGYHCRGLVGHCILTLSQGRMIGLTANEMSYQAQFGTLPTDATEDDVHMVTDNTEAETATVTIGRLPLNHTVTVKVRMDN